MNEWIYGSWSEACARFVAIVFVAASLVGCWRFSWDIRNATSQFSQQLKPHSNSVKRISAWINCKSTHSPPCHYLQTWQFCVTFNGEFASSGNSFQGKCNDRISPVLNLASRFEDVVGEWRYGSTCFELLLHLHTGRTEIQRRLPGT
jgi:hypothetical protein